MPSRRFPTVSKFARRLLQEWRQLKLPEATIVVVAVSGGADSVALLLALEELLNAGKLEIEIVVAHLNHKLRGRASNADARWVAGLSKKIGCTAIVGEAQVAARAAITRDNLEQAARRARYAFLEKASKSAKAGIVLTAHTLDDQAETVLLNLMRGSGAEGLSGIESVRPIKTGSKTLLVRPLVTWARRGATENYCRQRKVEFRVDEMNVDESFARVRVRRQLVPLMQTFNPRLVEGLARTAEILREESLALESAASRLLELSLVHGGAALPRDSVRVDLLRVAQPALRRRALRLWLASHRGDLRRLDRGHVLAVEKLIIGGKSGRVVELPGGIEIIKTRGFLQYCPRRIK